MKPTPPFSRQIKDSSRREWLAQAGLATLGATLLARRALGVTATPTGVVAPKRVLFFSKSSDFVHDVVNRHGQPLSMAERILSENGPAHGIAFTFSKDGSLFTPEYLAGFDAFCFYTSGDLFAASKKVPGGFPGDDNPPMTPAGKAALLEAVKGGKGFVGTHSAADTFHTGETVATDTRQLRTWRFHNFGADADPYTRMLGAGFILHGAQQVSTMRVIDPAFPGFGGLGAGFSRKDEWYSLNDFSRDLHVLLVQETAGMQGTPYQRPPYPATWARRHGQGRVFYTSMGHGDNALPGGNSWLQPIFLQILFGGLSWATGQVDADITPNIEQVTPGAWTLPPVGK